MNEGHNPYAPPLAEVKDAPQAGQALAGRGMRLLAAIVDGLVQLVLVWGVSLIVPWRMFSGDMSPGSLALNGVVGLLIFLALQGYLLVTRGQTIAKMLFGLRIVRSDGSRASAGRILGLRYGVGFVIGLVPFVGMIYVFIDCLLIFRQSRQCVHDQIADTIVVRA